MSTSLEALIESVSIEIGGETQTYNPKTGAITLSTTKGWCPRCGFRKYTDKGYCSFCEQKTHGKCKKCNKEYDIMLHIDNAKTIRQLHGGGDLELCWDCDCKETEIYAD